MKKLLVILLVLVLSSALIFSLTACDNGSEVDLSELISRISQLEADLEEARALGGIPGPEGPMGPKGPKGDTGLQGLSGESGIQELPTIRLNELFIYSNFGIELFSIVFFESTTTPGLIRYELTNLGFSSLIVNSVLFIAHINNDVLNFIYFTGAGSISQGSSISLSTGLNTNTGRAWFGFSSGLDMIPYLILDTSH